MQFVLLVGLIALGFALTKLGWLRPRIISWGNRYIIYIALPVVALANIPGLVLDGQLLVLVAVPLLILLLAIVLFQGVLRKYFSKDQRLVLSLTSGLGNTSFVGFPLIIFYLGKDQLLYGALFDQMTFLLMASVGQAMIANGQDAGVRSVVLKVLTFPVFITIVLCFFLPAGLFHGVVMEVFGWVIDSLSIVAMIIVGYLIATYVDFKIPRAAYAGLGYKLLIAPLVALFLLYWIEAPRDLEAVALLESSMAPQTSICLMLLEKNRLPQLVSQILCWGTVASLATSFVWILIA
ncbi:AEC family transporter [Marinoscillum sp.]|uniref:AEC family transporter n=1 Tax=Marinoscillum sp. TaxID=2024838 RepID=UPI003BAB0502